MWKATTACVIVLKNELQEEIHTTIKQKQIEENGERERKRARVNRKAPQTQLYNICYHGMKNRQKKGIHDEQ